jgi:hypothetical protein
VTYHTVRAWVRDFRAQCRAGQIPPFSPSRPAADRRVRPRSSQHGRKNRLSPGARHGLQSGGVSVTSLSGSLRLAALPK